MNNSQHSCPRRGEGSRELRQTEGPDTWDESGNCTYCGSFNPAVLMARIEAGDVWIGPTDKNYKAHLHNNGGAPFSQTFRTDTDSTGDKSKHVWTTKETGQGKFYFMHLNSGQMLRFIELYNAGLLKIGVPGHFYSLPYFMTRE